MIRPAEIRRAYAVMLRRWLLLMTALVPTVLVGMLLHALTFGGDFGEAVGRVWGYHLAVLAIVGGLTLLLSFTGARLVGGGAGLRLRDFQDQDGRTLVRLFLFTTPIYFLAMLIPAIFPISDPGQALILGLGALTPATIENFLATMVRDRA